MSKRSILIFKINPILPEKYKDEIVNRIEKSIKEYGIVVADEAIVDICQATIDGTKWEE